VAGASRPGCIGPDGPVRNQLYQLCRHEIQRIATVGMPSYNEEMPYGLPSYNEEMPYGLPLELLACFPNIHTDCQPYAPKKRYNNSTKNFDNMASNPPPHRVPGHADKHGRWIPDGYTIYQKVGDVPDALLAKAAQEGVRRCSKCRAWLLASEEFAGNGNQCNRCGNNHVSNPNTRSRRLHAKQTGSPPLQALRMSHRQHLQTIRRWLLPRRLRHQSLELPQSPPTSG
jgi:hypothetical protein